MLAPKKLACLCTRCCRDYPVSLVVSTLGVGRSTVYNRLTAFCWRGATPSDPATGMTAWLWRSAPICAGARMASSFTVLKWRGRAWCLHPSRRDVLTLLRPALDGRDKSVGGRLELLQVVPGEEGLQVGI